MKKLALSDEILLTVQQPARYIGGEVNCVMKNPSLVDIRFAMCFPDVYEIGMSHLGIQILYSMFNSREDIYCERVYSPWMDLDPIMREKNIPLFTLETQEPVNGGTVTREMLAQELQQEIAGKAEQSAVQASLSALSGSLTDSMQSTVEAMNAADAETNARVDQLFVFGTYEGDGETSQFISLGFTPRAVLICRTDGAFSQANLIYGGLATAASPAKTVEIAKNGFNVLSSSSLYNGNNPMYTFKYIALR